MISVTSAMRVLGIVLAAVSSTCYVVTAMAPSGALISTICSKTNREKLLREVFSKFLATGAPPCKKQKIGEIEISLLSNFQLRTTLGAPKNAKKQKIRKS